MLKWKIEEEKQGSKLSITINVDNVLTVSFKKSIDIERTKKKKQEIGKVCKLRRKKSNLDQELDVERCKSMQILSYLVDFEKCYRVTC